MEKAINEHGEIVLIRTPNMQKILTWSYQTMIPIAIVKGIDGAYEESIYDYLKKLYLNKKNRPWINQLLQETGVDVNTFPGVALKKAANLIFKSKIIKQ